MKLSENLDKIHHCGTFEFFNLMMQKMAEGREITPLVAGELSASTPTDIAKAGIDAITGGLIRYTLNTGIVELREAIARKLKNENKLNYSPDEIMVCCGAKHAIYNSVFATCGEGDEVILLAPFYPSYPDIVKLAKATPRIVSLKPDNNYQVDYEYLKKHISDKTRMIIINSPNNPTGAVLNEDSLKAVSKICLENNLWLLSDEIYEKVIYPPAVHLSPAQVLPEIHDKMIVVNGFSKTYAMTGWRIGYFAAPKELVSKADMVQSHMTANASTVSQFAALKALQTGDEFIEKLIPDLHKNLEIVSDCLDSIDGILYRKPEGAFYVFFSIEQFLGRQYGTFTINSSHDMALYLLNDAGVGLVPGAAFGAENFIRISYAPSVDIVSKGMAKIKSGLEQLK